MKSDLKGRTALVSGSTKGIGRAIAKHLAERSAKVVINGRSADMGEAVATDLTEETGTPVHFREADINDYGAVEAMVERVVDHRGKIDILVTNGAAAAGPPVNYFREMEPNHFEEFCTSHFLNRLYLIKAVLEPMIESGGGRILNVTSDAGRVPTPGELGPGAAAAALMMATRVLANEFSRWNITVNSLALSVTKDTNLAGAIADDSPVSTVFEEALEEQTFPLSADHVARLVGFLAADEGARPITGQTLSVTGGVSF